MNLLNTADALDGCPYCHSDKVRERLSEVCQETVQVCRNCDAEWIVLEKERISREAMMEFRPMMAASWPKELDGLPDDAYSELKLNGDRTQMVVTLAGAQFFTRTLSRADGLPVEKTACLPHLSGVTTEEPMILDGEITVPFRSDHTRVGELYNCSPEKSVRRQSERGKLLYVVFDILVYNGEDVRERPLSERIPLRNEVIRYLRSSCGKRYVHAVPSGYGPEYPRSVLKQGYEGVVVKDLFASYQSGDRPAGVWMKIKESLTVDLFITGYKAAKAASVKVGDDKLTRTKYAGQIGSVELSAMQDGKPVFVCYASGIPDAMRLTLTKNRTEYLGHVVEVMCQRVIQDRTGDISLQNPRIKSFREDKSEEDCLLDDLRRLLR